jgi:Fe-S cluster biogenesis protein NfuA
MPSGTANFTDSGMTARSPLAERLFTLPEVTGVFLGTDFITVSKNGDSDWQQLKPAVLAAIMEHFTAGRPVILADSAAPDATADGEEEDEIVTQIKELLETRVRPAVAMDGGDIIFQDFEDGVVYLHMQGSCSRPELTDLKAIENATHYIPEVVEVRYRGIWPGSHRVIASFPLP